MRLFAIAYGFWLGICCHLNGWRMRDGSPGLVTTSSLSIHLMVDAMCLVPVECPLLSSWLRLWPLSCRCPIPPAFIKESSCSAIRPLGHSLPSGSPVGELYGVIAPSAVRSSMVLGSCGEAIHRFIGMDLSAFRLPPFTFFLAC